MVNDARDVHAGAPRTDMRRARLLETPLRDPNPHTGDHNPRPIVDAANARTAALAATRPRTPTTPMRVSHDSTNHRRGPDHYRGI